MSQPQPDDLQILFPDLDMSLAGEQLTVRKLRMGEQIRYNAVLGDVASAFTALCDDPDDDRAMTVILDVLAEHWEAGMRDVIARSCGRDAEWIENLSTADGELLLMAWFTVNVGFFVRRRLRPLIQAAAKRLDGAKSSPPSPQPDTTGETSESTP